MLVWVTDRGRGRLGFGDWSGDFVAPGVARLVGLGSALWEPGTPLGVSLLLLEPLRYPDSEFDLSLDQRQNGPSERVTG